MKVFDKKDSIRTKAIKRTVFPDRKRSECECVNVSVVEGII